MFTFFYLLGTVYTKRGTTQTTIVKQRNTRTQTFNMYGFLIVNSEHPLYITSPIFYMLRDKKSTKQN